MGDRALTPRPAAPGGLLARAARAAPALYGLYPALALAASNAALLGTMWRDVALTALVCCLAPVAAAALLGRILGDRRRARLLVVLASFLAFTYGHAFTLLAHRVVLAGVDLGRNRYLLPAWIALWLAGTVWVLCLRREDTLAAVEAAVAGVGVALLAMAGGQLAVAAARRATAATAPAPPAEAAPAALAPAGRDVYFVLLDAYGSRRTLSADLGFDNADFVEALRRRGFVVPERTLANYPFTDAAVPAFLAMRYLSPGEDKAALLRRSRLLELARAAGYRTVAVTSWLSLVAGSVRADTTLHPGVLGEFSLELARTTIVGPWVSREAYRERTTAGLAALREIARDGRPTLTFAHVICPHAPYVFQASGARYPIGEPIHPTWESKAYYLPQLQYLNSAVLAIVDELLAGPPPRPVVVLFGDHGPDYYNHLNGPGEPTPRHLAGTMTTFAALYLPDLREPVATEGLSPVNLGRLVLDLYNGAGLGLLPDRAIWDRAGEHRDVTEVVLAELARSEPAP